jgi:hypothetical protein
MIRLREEMQTEKPTMLMKKICGKAAHLYVPIQCIFFYIWANSVCTWN